MNALGKLLVVGALVAAACGEARNTSPQVSPSAPVATATAVGSSPASCGEATPASTEGPYYKEGPPQKTSLVEPGAAGMRLVLSGVVRDTECEPLAGARVDFWQADGEGNYDNRAYRFRGYQLTDPQGRYRLETVVPGGYARRTPHIHVKVTPKGGETLTTQLYMPGVESNANDAIYNAALEIEMQGGNGTFDFVLP